MSTSLASAARDPDKQDTLTRFLFESNEFQGASARPKAFYPKFDAERERSETSVFRSEGLVEETVWQIAVKEVEPNRGKPTIARATLPLAVLREEQALRSLRVEADEPPPLHSVIVSWPEGDDNKSLRKSISQVLASKARVTKRP